ncbi:toll-Interleukin receptor [Vibrio vulnificus]|nr:toll-Interleukin receptor [Vibrio vulnificus]EIT7024315.1 toll-Interleukin receptor [Vibrio vulnificus]EIV8622985.1 toll-Interleukin receptor [Vibrio vulnificus]EKA7347814.1 toll-Interleukin receptor [Vibrio vulnificus]ELQ2526982.1 toll-Interleukin receptor [Vibrio vulnificus]
MKMFYSWSGVKSHRTAMAFAEWLPCVLNAVKPWVSSEDIDRGSIWLNDIMEQLKDTNYGLVFVTKENQSKPWILFESGALSKGLNDSRVFTVLIDLQVRDIDSGSPLKHLNHTALDKDGILKLLKSINKHLDSAQVQETVLEMSFNALWPVLEKQILDIQDEEPVFELPQRDDKDVLNDILDNVLTINKKIGSGRASNSRLIAAEHARLLIRRMVELGIGEQEITEILSELTPKSWLSKRLEARFDDTVDSDSDSDE